MFLSLYVAFMVFEIVLIVISVQQIRRCLEDSDNIEHYRLRICGYSVLIFVMVLLFCAQALLLAFAMFAFGFVLWVIVGLGA